MDTQRLKDKILQLAIQGKLVEQDPNDEPASILLEKIKEEKNKLVKENKIRKPRKLASITEDEKPFDIPESWEWVRLADITHPLILNDGDWIVSKNMDDKGSVKLLQLGSIGYGKYIKKGFKYITEETFNKLNCKEIKKGDILINRLLKDSMCVCEMPPIQGKTITTVDTCFIKPNHHVYNSRYLLYLFLSEYFQDQVFKKASGTTRQRISKGNLIAIAFPLPPLTEQKRIVEKVDQLFAIIDELDSNKEDLLKAIKLTRNQVLQKAIQGKLVEQDPEDEPANVLLEKIKKEKDRLVKEKKIRRPRKLAPITKDEKPFDIPKSWEWVRLGDVALINMGQSPKGQTVNDREGMEFHQGKVCFGDRYIKKSGKYTSAPKKIAQKGDILVSVRAPVGDVNITDREICIGRGLCAISSLGNMMSEYYFYLISALKKHLIDKATGTTFLAITVSAINEMLVPLPPLAEQRRIVEKVDKIMSICDKLEEQIDGENK